MIYGFLIVLHVLVAFLLIVVVLLQSGKGGGLAGSLGGTASTAMFGGQGADKLMVRVTSGLAAAFMILAMAISYTISHRRGVVKSLVGESAAGQLPPAPQRIMDLELPELEGTTVLPPAEEPDRDEPPPP